MQQRLILSVPLLGLILSIALGVLAPLTASAQRQRTPPPAIPVLSMTCPMHPDVVEERPGTCPLCKMRLIPVRLDSAWMCPIHSVVTDSKPGACRICGRDLIQVTVALSWSCRGEVNGDHLEPGLCSDGSPRVEKRTLRPHGNHNPQHGGQFFMAPDNWHHLEGTYPTARVFRLYLYDDYARALPANQLRRVQARVVTKETFDPGSRKSTELAAFPLKLARDGSYLEGRVDTASFPASMSAKVRIKPDGPEYRFDFTFAALTKDPAPAAQARTARATSSAPSSPQPRSTPPPVEALAVAPAPPAAAAPEPDPSLVQLPIPETVPEILAQLKARNSQIGELITRGDFGSVWVPAFQAKDLAVALEERLASAPTVNRPVAEPALRNVVRTAWLLDAVGDVGNRQQLEDAYASFTTAVAEVMTAFAPAQ